MKLIEYINKTKVHSGEVAIFSIAQAGFCLKTSANTRLYIDLYLSDSCCRKFGFKRMIPALVTPEEVEADIMVSTHAHEDHLDSDALPFFAKHPQTFFLGARDCRKTYQEIGISEERYITLSAGECFTFKDIDIRAVYADHGELAPDAVGFLFTVDGIEIYFTGDTAYTPGKILSSLNAPVDIMIAPINGHFGNLNAEEACSLALKVKPKVLIASHFGMFLEHGGDPAAFLEKSRELPKEITSLVMAPGERCLYSRKSQLIQCRCLKTFTNAKNSSNESF